MLASVRSSRGPRAHIILSALVTAVSLLGPWRSGAAQQRLDGRQPRFLLASPNGTTPVDIARSPSLRRPVTLELSGVPLTDAIQELSRQSGLAIVFDHDVIASGARVDLHVRAISV